MNPAAKAKMNSIFPGAPEWLKNSEKLRQEFAEMHMIWTRCNGFPEDQADRIAFEEFGYKNAHEYWNDRISEPMKASEFISLMVKHLRGVKEEGLGPEKLFEQAFDLARDMNEPWIYDGPRHKSLLVDSKKAACWLLSMPRQRHLVPATLAATLNGVDAPREAPAHNPRPRGRRPDAFNDAVNAMQAELAAGSLLKAQLFNFTEKEMAARYGKSRETVRKARDQVLEHVGKCIPDNSPANDK